MWGVYVGLFLPCSIRAILAASRPGVFLHRMLRSIMQLYEFELSRMQYYMIKNACVKYFPGFCPDFRHGRLVDSAVEKC